MIPEKKQSLLKNIMRSSGAEGAVLVICESTPDGNVDLTPIFTGVAAASVPTILAIASDMVHNQLFGKPVSDEGAEDVERVIN